MFYTSLERQFSWEQDKIKVIQQVYSNHAKYVHGHGCLRVMYFGQKVTFVFIDMYF